MFGRNAYPRRRVGVLLMTGACVLLLVVGARGAEEWHTGLVGAWYHGDDLTRVGTCMRIMDLEQVWDANRGRGNNWSAQWVGFVTAPADGLVTFCAESNKEFILSVDGQTLVHVAPGGGHARGAVSLVEGEKYPIHVTYLQHVGGTGHFSVTWSWAGQPAVAVSADALWFSTSQARFWNYVEKPSPDDFDFSSLRTIPVRHYFAYREPGRFGGWPANNGAWIWGNEILVGFHQGYHDPHASGGHAILSDKPQANVLARSLDGGKTWTVEDPDNFVEAAESRDDGETWRTLGKVAETDMGERNGNPPALVRLSDGRLCVAYGYRAFPFGIRVKISEDNGRTWGEEIALRTDGATWDLGYPRMVVRSDGKVVTIYYHTTRDVPAQHIGVTIWDLKVPSVKVQGDSKSEVHLDWRID